MPKKIHIAFFRICISLLVMCSISALAQNKKSPIIKKEQHKRQDLDIPEAIDSVRNSIVRIDIRFTAEQMKKYDQKTSEVHQGTGFFINTDGYIVTALHVINLPSELLSGLFISLPYPLSEGMRANFNQMSFEIVAKDIEHDLAILKLMRNPFTSSSGPTFKINGKSLSPVISLSPFNLQRLKDGTQIGSSGYPLGADVLISNVGYIASAWTTMADRFLVETNVFGQKKISIKDVYYADIRINHGNSGGPIYLIKTGEIIGVTIQVRAATVEIEGGTKVRDQNNQELLYNAGLGVVVPIKYVFDLARQNKIPIVER